MLVLGDMVLAEASRRNAPLRKVLALWRTVVESKVWSNLQQVRATMPTTDGVKLKSGFMVTVFNIKGNAYRLLAWLDYSGQTVEVLEVLTHAEYSKGRWKLRY